MIVVFATSLVNAQCENWIGKPTQTDAENAHSIYRQALKAGDYTTAFENWQIAYSLAPAADGRRDVHFMDGVEFYKQKWTQSQDVNEKAAYAEKIKN